MENNNNQLGDFFRKKFEELETSQADWSKPDPAVREHVLGQISSASPLAVSVGKAMLANKMLWVSTGLAAACIALIIYIGSLRERIDTVKNDYIQQQKEIAELEEKAEIKEAEIALYKKDIAILNLQKEQSFMKEEAIAAQKFHSEQSILPFYLAGKQNFQAKTENRVVNHKEEPFSSFLNTSDTLSGGKLIAEKRMSLSFLQAPSIPNSTVGIRTGIKMHLLPRSLAQFPPKKTEYRFSVGYERSWQQFEILVLHDFKPFRKVSELKREQAFTFSTHGISIGYAIKPNFWIEGGIRRGNWRFELASSHVVEYDKGNEIRDPIDGSVSQEVVFSRMSPYFESRADINLQTSRADEIDNGELVAFSIEESQEAVNTQITLGIAYQIGNRRLKAVLNGGGAWHQNQFNDYTTATTTKSDEREIFR